MKKVKKKVAPAAKKRGADAHVPSKSRAHRLANEEDRKLEQGLEESMAGRIRQASLSRRRIKTDVGKTTAGRSGFVGSSGREIEIFVMSLLLLLRGPLSSATKPDPPHVGHRCAVVRPHRIIGPVGRTGGFFYLRGVLAHRVLLGEAHRASP